MSLIKTVEYQITLCVMRKITIENYLLEKNELKDNQFSDNLLDWTSYVYIN